MNILHIIPNLGKGGAERICLDMCLQLKKNGHNVKLILLEDRNEYPELTKDMPFEFFDLLKDFSVRRYLTQNFRAFEKAIKSFTPDVVHTHLFGAEIIWKLTQFSVPTVFHIHDNIKVFSPFKNGLLKKISWITWYEKRNYLILLKKQPTYFLTISKGTFDYIKETLNPNEKNLGLINNAIDTNKFNSNIKRDLSDIRLVSIGSLVKKKGHKFLLEVMSFLKKKSNCSVRMKILGGGPLKQFLLEYAKQIDVLDVVDFKGKVDFPEKYLEEANIYLHGALEEPFGLVLIEAMASGLPVFSTDGGGNRDLLNHNENGFIYYDRDAEKIASDILMLINDESKYTQISSAGKKFSEDFDIVEYTIKITELYGRLKY
jgi:glycosyltransferase involved in cell wall biosynthesis